MVALVPSEVVAVGVGAVLGAVSRHQAGKLAAEWIASDPQRLGRYQGWHTAAINVGGSFVLGSVAGAPLTTPSLVRTKPSATPAFGLSPRAKLLLGVGFCGSFTTFSTYSVDIVGWLAKGETTKVIGYMMTNNVGGVLAAATGMMLVKKLFG